MGSRKLLGLLATLLLVTLGACSSDGDAQKSSSVLRYGYHFAVSRFDPQRATTSYDETSLMPTYDRLVHLDKDGGLVPGLAAGWEYSDDVKTLTLTLRDDVTYHDGEKFDAESVKANFERGQSIDGSTVKVDLSSIESVEVPDSTTVVLNLSKPDSSLIRGLSGRPGMMISPAAFDNKDLDSQPVGAGMFEVEEFRAGDRVVYTAYKDYWDKDAQKLDGLEIIFMPDQLTRLNALKSGALDATWLNPDQGEAAEAAGLTVQAVEGLQNTVLQPNRARSEFGDVRVRRAMNYAIDRASLAAELYGGNVEANTQFFPSSYTAYNPEFGVEAFAYSPEKAKQLLTEAGLPNGFEFEITVLSRPDYIKLAEVLKEQLAKSDITANLKVIELTSGTQRCYVELKCDSELYTWGGRVDPLLTLDSHAIPGNLQNMGDHTTPEIEALSKQIFETVDEDKRADLLKEYSGIMARDAFVFNLFSVSNLTVETKAVKTLEPSITSRQEFRGAQMAD